MYPGRTGRDDRGIAGGNPGVFPGGKTLPIDLAFTYCNHHSNYELQFTMRAKAAFVKKNVDTGKISASLALWGGLSYVSRPRLSILLSILPSSRMVDGGKVKISLDTFLCILYAIY
jgi:hypothetical protein